MAIEDDLAAQQAAQDAAQTALSQKRLRSFKRCKDIIEGLSGRITSDAALRDEFSGLIAENEALAEAERFWSVEDVASVRALVAELTTGAETYQTLMDGFTAIQTPA